MIDKRSRTNFDHSACDHEPTLNARAACRSARAGRALDAVDKAISEVLFDGEGVQAGVYAISSRKRVEIAEAAIAAYQQWLRAEGKE